MEACLTSDIRIGVIPRSMKTLRRFFEAGLKVFDNAVDPSMFWGDMNEEYLQFHRELGFTPDELFRLSLKVLDLIPPREGEMRMKRVFEEGYGGLS